MSATASATAASHGSFLAGLGALAVAAVQYVTAPHTAQSTTEIVAALGSFLTVSGLAGHLAVLRSKVVSAGPSALAALHDAEAAAKAAREAAGSFPVVAAQEAQVREWVRSEIGKHPTVTKDAEDLLEGLRALVKVPIPAPAAAPPLTVQ